MSRIAFVTSRAWAPFVEDDLPAVAALERLGHGVTGAVWDDLAVDWTAFDLVVPRSCWDYPDSVAAFLAWIDRLEAKGVVLCNPPATLRWNIDKRYLTELGSLGVSIVPTELAGAGASLAELLAGRGWDRAVVKPRIGADGHRTMRVEAGAAAAAQPALDALTSAGGALVQPYIAEIEWSGELSFVFLGGAWSHAVRKLPAPGEFRVQPRLGATWAPASLDPALVEQAAWALAFVPRPWLYARVDGCVVDGRLLVMEVELVEPTLFFDERPASASEFAAVLDAVLAGRR